MDKIGLTIEEVTEYTGIGRDTIRKMIEWGKLPVLHIGRKTIIRRDIIEKFMEINLGIDLLIKEQVRKVE